MLGKAKMFRIKVWGLRFEIARVADLSYPNNLSLGFRTVGSNNGPRLPMPENLGACLISRMDSLA